MYIYIIPHSHMYVLLSTYFYKFNLYFQKYVYTIR